MPIDKTKIRQAFLSGELLVESVDSVGTTRKSPIKRVLRHNSIEKECVQVVVAGGAFVVCTTDHRLFLFQDGGICPVQASQISVGDQIAGVVNGRTCALVVAALEKMLPHQHTYDLSVPGDQNFVLANGILAHNSYSIGGINLDIEKSSKYESLKNNAEGQFDKAVEAKARTVRIFMGLQQPRFGVGIRSAFGPAVGRGVLSPRGFIGM